MAERTEKGKSLFALPENYVIIDLETTGLDPSFDEIIELGAIRVRNGKAVDTYSKLVKPRNAVSDFISELTGITNEMLEDAAPIETLLPEYLDFLGEDIIVGHNVHFDINFLYDDKMRCIGLPLKNDFVNTIRISRRLFPDFKNHRLQTLVAELGIQVDTSHRALSDCQAVLSCMDHFLQYMAANNLSLDDIKPNYRKLCADDIVATNHDFDTNHPLYGKCCVFTGTLDKMARKDAMQLVVNLGGSCADSVSKKIDYLILGNNDYCKTIKDGKSTKQKRAEALILKGYSIEILSENTFYDLVNMEA